MEGSRSLQGFSGGTPGGKTVRNIRFTTRGKTLYAIALGWPEDVKEVIKSLARTDDARANHMWRVESRGHKFPLPFTQTSEGLTVELPHEKPGDLTCSLIVTERNLLPFIPPATVRVVRADPTGTLTLSATDAGL